MGSIKIKGATSGSMVLTVPNTGSDNVPVNVDAINSITGKNLIINGGFDVWQRGTSFTPTGSAIYTADRWKFEGSSLTISRSTDVPSGNLFKYSARLQNTSGGASNNRSYLEDLNTLLPNGVPWVLSVWIKVVSGGISIDLGDTALAGGFNSSAVWTKVSISGSNRNTASGGVNGWMDIYLDANTDAYITGIQLELGSVATNFDYRSYGEELALCQRYYQTMSRTRGSGNGDSGQNVRAFSHKILPMRTTPTVSFITQGNDHNFTNKFFANITSEHISVLVSVNNAGYWYYNHGYVADAEL